MRLRKTLQRGYNKAITLTFLRICSLAFLFSSFLASITLLETKFIKSAILDFFERTLTISFKYRGSTARKESWLIVQKMAGSCARKESEIVQVLKDVSSVREIENKYRYIAIKDIQQETDFSACVVKGKPIKSRLT